MIKSESLLIEIAKKSLENAEDLINDAGLLKQSMRYPRSYALYQLAKEEIGKSIWVTILLINKDYENPEKDIDFENFFKSHKLKSKQAASLDFIIAQVLFKGNVGGAIKKIEDAINERENSKKINDLKNLSLYTSIVDNKVTNPKENISIRLLENIEESTMHRLSISKAFVNAAINNLKEIREYQKDITDTEIDEQEYVKQFWSEIIENE